MVFHIRLQRYRDWRVKACGKNLTFLRQMYPIKNVIDTCFNKTNSISSFI